jgi:hypothetical protein
MSQNEEGVVGGQVAVTFFKKSGLDVDKLKKIWTIAAQTSKAHLTRDEFYVALRLIAYEQNGIKADESSLKINIEAPLPEFSDGDKTNARQTQPRPAPEIDGDQIAKMLPSLDDLDLNQFENVTSLIPSVDKKMKEQQARQMQMHQPRPMPHPVPSDQGPPSSG